MNWSNIRIILTAFSPIVGILLLFIMENVMLALFLTMTYIFFVMLGIEIIWDLIKRNKSEKMSEKFELGELERKIKELGDYSGRIDKVLRECKKEFYTIWNNAYGSSAQQGIDVYNKWFLKWFGEQTK